MYVSYYKYISFILSVHSITPVLFRTLRRLSTLCTRFYWWWYSIWFLALSSNRSSWYSDETFEKLHTQISISHRNGEHTTVSLKIWTHWKHNYTCYTKKHFFHVFFEIFLKFPHILNKCLQVTVSTSESWANNCMYIVITITRLHMVFKRTFLPVVRFLIVTLKLSSSFIRVIILTTSQMLFILHTLLTSSTQVSKILKKFWSKSFRISRIIMYQYIWERFINFINKYK